MDFLSGVVLVLLTLVGYSSGAIVAGKSRSVAPRLFDLFLVILLWVAALSTRSMLGKWAAILIWLVAGGIVGVLLTLLRLESYETREPKASGSKTGNIFRRVIKVWNSFAARIGNYQSRLILSLFYFVVVTPYGLFMKLFSDPLCLRRTQSCWIQREAMNAEFEDAKRQF